MNRAHRENVPPQRIPTTGADPADMPLVLWVRRLDVRNRIGLKKRLAERARLLESDPHFIHRVDREEAARVAALFLEYADAARLSPGEVSSLLRRAGHDATLALDELDGRSRARPSRTPGRNASCGASSRAESARSGLPSPQRNVTRRDR